MNNNSIKELEGIFPKTIGDFARINLQVIGEIKINKNEEYENLQDVAIYTNANCSKACGIIVEQFNGKAQLTITRFDDLVLLNRVNDKVIDLNNIEQLENNSWGYEGCNDVGITDINDIEGAKKILFDYLERIK